jgi:hypothetical protein
MIQLSTCQFKHANFIPAILKTRDLWICQYCQRQFSTRNQSHTGGFFSIEQHLEKANPKVISLYEQFVVMVENCGDIMVEATKTSIAFKTPQIFAVVHLQKSGLRIAFWLPHQVKHPRIQQIYKASAHSYAHHVRLNNADELDSQLQNWLCEAYLYAL